MRAFVCPYQVSKRILFPLKTECVNSLFMSRCGWENCTCASFKPHKYRKSALCIECEHLADLHGVSETSYAEPLAVSLNSTLASMTRRSQSLGSANLDPRSPKLMPDVSEPSRKKGVPDRYRMSMMVSSQMSSLKDLQSLVTEVAEEKFAEILKYKPPPERFKTRRDKIAQEIFTSEQSYVGSLDFILRSCRDPMMQDPLLQKEVTRMFSCMVEILNTNKILLRNLYNKIQIWNELTTLGDEFRALIPFLRMYTAYCASFEEATRRIVELEKQSIRFSQIMKEIQSSPDAKGRNLHDHLIMPVQRVPRYTLLFQDFLKETSPEHPDYNGIKQTLDAVKDVANRINEGIREQENRYVIIDLQNQFTPPLQLVEAHRKHIINGYLWKVCRKEKKKRFFILFSDAFLHCKRITENSLSLSQFIELSQSRFDETVDDEPLGFAIRSRQKSFVMIANDAAERDEWVSAFRKVLERFPESLKRELSYFAPIWKADRTSDVCYKCQKAFSFSNRKHHCRRCGEIVCGDCSSKRMVIKDEPERVCDRCYDQANSMRGTMSPESLIYSPN